MPLTAALLGGAIGLTLGAVGGGGSVLAVPVLVYVVGESVHRATTASLAIVAAAALVGAAGHMRGGRVCWRHAIAVSVPAIAGIVAGTAANRAVGSDLLLALFAPVMVLAAWATWTRASETGVGDGARARLCPPLHAGRDVATGAAIGLLTGFFGVGGGFVVVPALALALGFPLRSAVATSLVVVGAVSLAGLGAHLASGARLDAPVTAAMAAATAAGAAAGARLAPRVSQERLAKAFALLVVAVAGYLVIASVFLGGAPKA